VPICTSVTWTPGVDSSRVFTARTQWAQVMPTISIWRGRIGGEIYSLGAAVVSGQ